MKKLRQGNIVAVRDGDDLEEGDVVDACSESGSDSDEEKVCNCVHAVARAFSDRFHRMRPLPIIGWVW